MTPLDEFAKNLGDALKQRDEAVSKRQNNFFLGPVGVEERIEILTRDAGLAMWAIQNLLIALRQERSEPN